MSQTTWVGWDRLDVRQRLAALRKALPWLGAGLSVAVFVADLSLPRSIATGAIYVLCVLATAGHPSRNMTLGVACLTSLQTVIAATWTAVAAAAAWADAVNGAITLAAIWASAGLLLAHLRTTVRVAEVEERALADATWLARTLASIGDGVIAVNRSGSVRFMNPVAETLTGWTAGEAVGQPLDAVFDIRSEQTGEPLPNPATRALEEAPAAGPAGAKLLQSRTGELWPIDESASPILDDLGGSRGCVVVFREISERRRREGEMEIRLRESGHRIRNVFANMRALLTLCERTSATPADLVKCMELRIASLVRSTDRLQHAPDGATSSHDIIVGELSPYLESRSGRLRISGDDVLMAPGNSLPFAMIIHELANNAAKYGSLSTERGRIEVRLQRRVAGVIALDWREFDGPPVVPPQRKGLGSQLISGLVRMQFSGDWNPDYAQEGFRCTVTLRLPDESVEAEPL
ncbi:sensor histidine kinase [Microbaculum marinum]|uniref:Blue-light-activated histidine kinase n=1 Tax=Microbaculum marinum TaxID=1764581 RepID=A0AAW9RMG5_9HYPH